MSGKLRLIIVSGLSGSGKSVALHVLEDLGYYCIDNLPAGLLIAAVDEVRRSSSDSAKLLAVGVDALFFEVHDDPDRAICDGPNQIPLDDFPGLLESLPAS